jgi:hypothetical protein
MYRATTPNASVSQDVLPPAPPGIAPEVLSKIDALFRRTGSPNFSVNMADGMYEAPAAEIEDELDTPQIGETTSATKNDGGKEQSRNKKSNKRHYQVPDRGTRKKRTRRAAEQDPPIERIIARFAYPSEPRLPPLGYTPCQPETVEPTSSPRHLASSLNLFSVFAQAMYCISTCLTSYCTLPFSLIRRTMIRYSSADESAHMEIELEDFSSTSVSERVVRVIAFVVDEEAESAKENGNAKLLEMRARHKRVREIMRESGYLVEEELYETEIRAALERLKE